MKICIIITNNNVCGHDIFGGNFDPDAPELSSISQNVATFHNWDTCI